MDLEKQTKLRAIKFLFFAFLSLAVGVCGSAYMSVVYSEIVGFSLFIVCTLFAFLVFYLGIKTYRSTPRIQRAVHADAVRMKFDNWSYMPRFCSSAIDKKMKNMPLEDLATIAIEADRIVEDAQNGLVKHPKRAVRLSNEADEIRGLMARRLLTQEYIFVVKDERTHCDLMASVDGDYGYILVNYEPRQSGKYYALKISAQDIKNYLYAACSLRGAKGCIVRDVVIPAEKFFPATGDIVACSRDEAVDTPQRQAGQQSAAQKPVRNPDLYRMLIRLATLERDGAEQDDEEREDAKRGNVGCIEELRQELKPIFSHARFLVPIKKLQADAAEKQEQAAHAVTLKEGTAIVIPMLISRLEETKRAFPLFTDWVELEKIYSTDEFEGLVLDAQDLVAFNSDLFVLNAATLCYELRKDQIRDLLGQLSIARKYRA